MSPTVKSFRVVRAGVRAVRMPGEIRARNVVWALSLFPFVAGGLPFPLWDLVFPLGDLVVPLISSDF